VSWFAIAILGLASIVVLVPAWCFALHWWIHLRKH